MILIPLFLYCFVIVEADRRKLRDCIRPWQVPLMSIATISTPARPLECLPDSSTCPKAAVCQFSLKSFKYICCQDKKDVEPPVCPKFHDTLLMTCGSENDSACPRGYNCLQSRYDRSVSLCCKPNDNITYPEPETTFKDNRIVPQILKKAPPTEAEITFGNDTIVMGQLFDPTNLDHLIEEPSITFKQMNEDSFYTLFLLDTNTLRLSWFVANVQSLEGKLQIGKGSRVLVEYVPPSETDTPKGVHVMVLAVFEQNARWDNRELASIPFDDFLFSELERLKSIQHHPISASFYGYTTEDDQRS